MLVTWEPRVLIKKSKNNSFIHTLSACLCCGYVALSGISPHYLLAPPLQHEYSCTNYSLSLRRKTAIAYKIFFIFCYLCKGLEN